MAPHLLSFSARARQEQEALKVALANGDGASLKRISERLAHRQGPGALQLLMRKLASNAEALAFWQQQLLPVDVLVVEDKAIDNSLVKNTMIQETINEHHEHHEEVEEVEEVIQNCPPEPIAEKKIEVTRRLRGWLPSWNGPLRQAS